MARTSLEEYLKKIKEQNQSTLDAENKAVTDMAAANKQIIADQYDAADKIIKDKFNTQIGDTVSQYANARTQNAVQRVANERKIREKTANLGLTDSGLNRTQQTAVDLSYSNNLGEINRSEQKALDTLAATMNSQITQNAMSKAADMGEIDTKTTDAIAKNNAAFDKWAQEQAVDLYNEDTKAIADAQKAAADAYDDVEKYVFGSASDKLKRGRIQTAYDKGYISSEQKTYYESLVSAIGPNNGVVDYNAVKKVKNDILSEKDFYESATAVERIGGRRGNVIGNNYSYEGRTYANYKEYVKAQLQDMYEKYGIIGETELRDLLEYYKI